MKSLRAHQPLQNERRMKFSVFSFLRRRKFIVGCTFEWVQEWISVCAAMAVFLLFCSCVSAQTVDRYPLPTVAQQQQFQGLISQLRCLVCQNQDLADSNADLAKDLRRQVYEMVLAKQTDAQIKQYMTDRYGDFILFKPPFNPQTTVLWVMPFLLLAVGLIILWRLTRSRKNNV